MPKTKITNDIKKEKIRRQYFNSFLYYVALIMSVVPVAITVSELKKGIFDIWGTLKLMITPHPVVYLSYGVLFVPLIILSVLNRFCFGDIVATIKGDNIFVNGRKIEITSIKEIIATCKTNVFNQVEFYSRFILYTDNGETDSVDVMYFPMYGARKIKKCNPDVKIKYDKYICILVCSPLVIVIGLSLFFAI